MAEAIAQGIAGRGRTWWLKSTMRRGRQKRHHHRGIRSKAILVGSPTINRGMLSAIAGILEEIRGMAFKNKKAAAFGAYGWSGESVKMITERLKEGGFDLVNEGLKALWDPDEKGIQIASPSGRSLRSG